MLVLVDILFCKELAIKILSALPIPTILHRLLLSILQAVGALLIICFWVYQYVLNVIYHAKLVVELPVVYVLRVH